MSEDENTDYCEACGKRGNGFQCVVTEHDGLLYFCDRHRVWEGRVVSMKVLPRALSDEALAQLGREPVAQLLSDRDSAPTSAPTNEEGATRDG